MQPPVDTDAYYFKLNPRPGQLDAIRKAALALKAGTAAIIRAPTGFGKTSMGLTAILPLLADDGLAFFAARTHAQNKQVLREANLYNAHATARGLPLQLRVLPLVGRTKACQKLQSPLGGDWESFAQQCKRLRDQHRCEYFSKFQAYKAITPLTFPATGVIDTQEAAEFCQREGMCLYYFLFAHVPGANLLVGNYNYILNPAIRQALLQDDVLQVDDLVVVFDEAHNLPDLCRKIASRQLARKWLDDGHQKLKERKKYLQQRNKDFQGDKNFQRLFPKTWDFLVGKIEDWIDAVEALDASLGRFQDPFNQILIDQLDRLPPYERDRYQHGFKVEVGMDPALLDALLPPSDVEFLANPSFPPHERRSTILNEYLEATFESLWEALDSARLGDAVLARELPPTDGGWERFIRDYQLGGEKLETFARTFVHVIVNFLAHRLQYLVDGTKQFALVAHACNDSSLNYTLDITCFDARVAFAFVRDQSAGIVCMSGSLDKRDLAVLGIPSQARGMQDISDFRPLVPPDHWQVLVDPEDMTDRVLKAKDKWKGIAARVVAIASETPGGVGVFCRNYDHVDKLAGALGPKVAGKRVFVEEPGERRSPGFINDYKDAARGPGAILLACTSGKYSEGEDFPGAEMNAAIVVGYPYPPRSATNMGLAAFLDTIFPFEGEQVAFHERAAKLVAQVAGRCVRSEDDRGLIVLIDARMGSESFVTLLPGFLQAIKPLTDYSAILPHLRKFFAPYLDFLLAIGQGANGEPDPGAKVAKAKKFLAACKYYFSENHLPWAQDPKLAGRMREIRRLKNGLRPLVP